MVQHHVGWHVFDERTLATVLAALRHYQNHIPDVLDGDDWLHDIATHGGAVEAMTVDEIDLLCEQINAGGDDKAVKALQVAQMLVDAYIIAEADGGSVDWSDIDAAHALALEIYGADDQSPAVDVATGKSAVDDTDEPDIVTMMELSPLHLSEFEFEVLEAVKGVTAYPLTHGCLVHVPEDDLDIHLLPRQEDGGPSNELVSLLWFAYARSVRWIRFSNDVKAISQLPVFMDSWLADSSSPD